MSEEVPAAALSSSTVYMYSSCSTLISSAACGSASSDNRAMGATRVLKRAPVVTDACPSSGDVLVMCGGRFIIWSVCIFPLPRLHIQSKLLAERQGRADYTVSQLPGPHQFNRLLRLCHAHLCTKICIRGHTNHMHSLSVALARTFSCPPGVCLAPEPAFEHDDSWRDAARR
jgi:hypothetical protein